MQARTKQFRLSLLRCTALPLSPPLGSLADAQDSYTSDVGTLDKGSAEKVFPARRPYRPGPVAISRLARCLATLTSTPRFPWMPARLVPGWGQPMLTASPRGRRSWPGRVSR